MSNNVAPARIGELVRTFLVSRETGVSGAAALGTVAIDRVFDGLALLAILGIVIAVSGADPAVTGIGIGAALIFFAAAAVLLALAFVPEKASAVLLRLVAFLPAAVERKVGDMLGSFLAGLQGLRSPWVLVQATAYSFISWGIEASMYYVVGEAFNLGVDLHVYLLITAGANLALSVFASPGGVGPFEVTTREILVVFSVGSATASAYAIALHVLLLAPVIVVGFFLLWGLRLSLSDLMGIKPPPKPQEPEEAGPVLERGVG
jgi:uncharacterized protein (TIRG00374 family)